MIRIENLSKSFGTKNVLKNINLNFEKGKIYGVVGKNGSGKTTLFNCISGNEFYDGDIHSEYENLKNHIGLLETNPVILSRITGWEYLKLLSTSRDQYAENFEEQNIFELPLDEYAENYSTGMKKKLAFMGILLQKNDVFILDEPFNGVDIQSNILISAIIEELRKKDKIVIISSHVFSTLSKICDRIYLLNNGSIEKSVSKDKYEELENQMIEDVVNKNVDKLIL